MIKSAIASLFLASVFLVCDHSYAQTAEELQSRAYVKLAEESFAAKDYAETLDVLSDAERLLGKSHDRIESLKAKALYYSGDYSSAKQSIDIFYQIAPADSPALTEMARLARSIDDKLEEQQTREAADRRANAENARQARLVESQIAREKSEALNELRERQDRVLLSCTDIETCKNAYEIASDKQNNKSIDLALRHSFGWDAIILSAKVCDLGDSEGCAEYAHTLSAQRHLTHKRLEKRLFYHLNLTNQRCETQTCLDQYKFIQLKTSCLSNNNLKSCENASAFADYGTSDYRALQEKRCALRDGLACGALASQYMRSYKHTSSSLRYRSLACDYGNDRACSSLAEAYWLGHDGLKKNRRLSRQYYQKYCDVIWGRDAICQKRIKWKKP